MKITSIAGCPYEDYEGQILELHVQIDENETINVGDNISIDMMDDTVLTREVKIINPEIYADFACVSQKVAEDINSTTKKSKKKRNPTLSLTGPAHASLVVLDVPYHDVKTDENTAFRSFMEESSRREN